MKDQKMQTKLKRCAGKNCENQFQPYLSTDKYCSYSCTRKANDERTAGLKAKNINPIKQVSKRQALLNAKYAAIRKEVFAGAFLTCPVYPHLRATEIHHMRKRRGFADDWARENNVPLIIDKRFMLAVSSEGHRFIEDNPEMAYAKGWSEKNN